MNNYNFYSVNVKGGVLAITLPAANYYDAKDSFDAMCAEHGFTTSCVNVDNYKWSADNIVHSVLRGKRTMATSYMYSTLQLKDGSTMDCNNLTSEGARELVFNTPRENISGIVDMYRVKCNRELIPLEEWKLYTIYLMCMEMLRNKVDPNKIIPFETYVSMDHENDLDIDSALCLAGFRLLLIKNHGIMSLVQNYNTFREKVLEYPEMRKLLG